MKTAIKPIPFLGIALVLLSMVFVIAAITANTNGHEWYAFGLLLLAWKIDIHANRIFN